MIDRFREILASWTPRSAAAPLAFCLGVLCGFGLWIWGLFTVGIWISQRLRLLAWAGAVTEEERSVRSRRRTASGVSDARASASGVSRPARIPSSRWKRATSRFWSRDASETTVPAAPARAVRGRCATTRGRCRGTRTAAGNFLERNFERDSIVCTRRRRARECTRANDARHACATVATRAVACAFARARSRVRASSSAVRERARNALTRKYARDACTFHACSGLRDQRTKRFNPCERDCVWDNENVHAECYATTTTKH